jgi:hypothetical protein
MLNETSTLSVKLKNVYLRKIISASKSLIIVR